MKRLKYHTTVAAIIVIMLAASGCNKLKLYNFSQGDVVASVGQYELYTSDITPLIESGLSPEDSLKMVETVIDRWVRRQLRTIAASNEFKDQQSDIEQMVEQYRNSLLSYKYEEQWLEGRLDTTVTSQQTKVYYDANRDNFRLAGPIVKARVARIPSGIRQNKKMEDLFASRKSEDQADFLNMCQKNNYRYDDFSTSWTDFSTVVSRIPFTHSNFDEFLKSRNYYEVEDDQYKYMMAIDSYLSTGDYSPLEQEVENIRKIVINKRRQSALATMEDSLYNAAVAHKQFEIKIK